MGVVGGTALGTECNYREVLASLLCNHLADSREKSKSKTNTSLATISPLQTDIAPADVKKWSRYQ